MKNVRISMQDQDIERMSVQTGLSKRNIQIALGIPNEEDLEYMKQLEKANAQELHVIAVNSSNPQIKEEAEKKLISICREMLEGATTVEAVEEIYSLLTLDSPFQARVLKVWEKLCQKNLQASETESQIEGVIEESPVGSGVYNKAIRKLAKFYKE
ncbi:MAG: hypothetical protein WC438_02805 [Candidatus Pacearchaeota archaeon]